MNYFILLLLPFCAAFFMTLFVLWTIDANSRQQRRLGTILKQAGYKDVEKVTQFQKKQKGILRLYDSDNFCYVYSSLIAMILYLFNGTYFLRIVPHSLRLFIYLLPFAAFVLIPFFYKKWITETRREEILVTMPIIIDLLIICLEAGLSFASSIDKIVHEVEQKSTFLAKRFQQMVYELNAGVNRKEALTNLVKRCYNNEDLKTFISAIIQSETLGFSIAQTLRVQAEEIRQKRRQMIRTRIARMPIKLLFPLVFCIFPITCILQAL